MTGKSHHIPQVVEDFDFGHGVTLKAGQLLHVDKLQQLLEGSGQIDNVKFKRPKLSCTYCPAPVFFYKRSKAGKAEHYAGRAKDHDPKCYFHNPANEAVRSELGGEDLPDPKHDYPTGLIRPSDNPHAGQSGVVTNTELESITAKSRVISNHRPSLLRTVCFKYLQMVESYGRSPKAPAARAELKKLKFFLNSRVSNYEEAFYDLLSRNIDPANCGERIWFMEIEKVVRCSDGLLFQGRKREQGVDLTGFVEVSDDLFDYRGIDAKACLLEEVAAARCLFAVGKAQKKRVDEEGRDFRHFKVGYLPWVHVDRSPHMGKGAQDRPLPVEENQEDKTMDEVRLAVMTPKRPSTQGTRNPEDVPKKIPPPPQLEPAVPAAQEPQDVPMKEHPSTRQPSSVQPPLSQQQHRSMFKRVMDWLFSLLGR